MLSARKSALNRKILLAITYAYACACARGRCLPYRVAVRVVAEVSAKAALERPLAQKGSQHPQQHAALVVAGAGRIGKTRTQCRVKQREKECEFEANVNACKESKHACAYAYACAGKFKPHWQRKAAGRATQGRARQERDRARHLVVREGIEDLVDLRGTRDLQAGSAHAHARARTPAANATESSGEEKWRRRGAWSNAIKSKLLVPQ